MPRSIPVTLSNGKSWPTKKAAKEHFTAMLARYKNCERVAAQDAADLAALLDRYDRSCLPGEPTKIGIGISHFTRQLNVGNGYATPGFHVHRIDGSSIDFSFWDAVQIDAL